MTSPTPPEPRTGRSTGKGLSHLALLADLVGYHAGRAGCGYKPEEWDEHVRAWIKTDRGREALTRMALVHRGACKCEAEVPSPDPEATEPPLCGAEGPKGLGFMPCNLLRGHMGGWHSNRRQAWPAEARSVPSPDLAGQIARLPTFVTYQHPEGPTGEAEPVEFEAIEKAAVLALLSRSVPSPDLRERAQIEIGRRIMDIATAKDGNVTVIARSQVFPAVRDRLAALSQASDTLAAPSETVSR